MARWIHGFQLPVHSLQTARQLFAIGLLVAFWPQWLWVSGVATSFYQPQLGLASLFSAPPGQWFFVLLNAIGIIATVGLLFGRGVPAASVTLPIVLWIGNSFEYSFGKIDHDILLLFTPIVGALLGWGGQRGNRRSWPLALFALAIGIAMAHSGMVKISTGWLDPTRLAVRAHMIANHVGIGRESGLSSWLIGVPSPILWEAMDWSAVLLELACVVAVIKLKWFRVWCGVACVFHLANALIFRIPFYSNVLAYGLFVAWPVWSFARVSRRVAFGVASGVAAMYLVFGNPLAEAVRKTGDDPDAVLPVPIIVAGVAVALVAWRRTSFASSARRYVGDLVRPHMNVVLFDGHCGLCNGWVDYLLRHDRRGVWQFAPLQSAFGVQLLKSVDLPATYTDSVVVVRGGWIYTHSNAVVVALAELEGPWRLVSLLLLLPSSIRDIVYTAVARLRYRIFGRVEVCRIPTPSEQAKFLSYQAET